MARMEHVNREKQLPKIIRHVAALVLAAVPSAFLLSHTDYANLTEAASQGVLAA